MNRDQLIDEYATGGKALKAAVDGLQRADLLAYPVPGTWSIQEIVLHLMDTELILADRMKRVIAEENPPLMAFNETQFARNLFYGEQSAEDAVTMIELIRRNFARVLKKLPDEAFNRVGQHSERGPMKLSDLIEAANKHLKHHLGFIIDKRAKLRQ
jgi:hypothetical protein